MIKMKCGFVNCKCPAVYVITQTVGKKQSLPVCENHKPDVNKRPPSLRHIPLFFDIRLIDG